MLVKYFKKNKPKGQKDYQSQTILRRRFIAVVFCFLFVLTTVLGSVAFKAKPAHALFGVGDVSITAGDIPRTITRILDKIISVVKEGIKQLAIVSLNNAIDAYVQNLAYESAVYLATGDAGKKPLIFSQPLGKALEDAGGAILGDFLDRMSKDIIGHSLCEPIDPRFNLQLTIFLEQSQKPAKPKCTLNGIGKAFEQSWTNIQSSGLGLKNLNTEDVIKFSNYFDPRSNNLGTFMVAEKELKQKIKKAKELETKTREIEGQFRSLRKTISEEVITPGSTIESSLENVQQAATQKSIPAKSTDGGSIMNILARGLTTFSQTFLGEWTKTLFKKGLVEPTKKAPSDALFIQSVSGTASARKFYSELVKPLFDTDITVDVTSQLANCPSDPKAQRWYNCRISSDLKQAIDQEITLKEAVTSAVEGGYGLLEPSAIFGFDKLSRKEPDWENGLPYSSLVVMRKYRIAPVTWELAALYIRDVMADGDHGNHREWTIKDVMDCYEQVDSLDTPNVDESMDNTLPENCRINPNDSNSINPFYHLVNPDWVLKAPATRCYQEGPGPEIVYEEFIEVPRVDLTGGSDYETVEQRIISRADYCADERTCVKEDAEGNCLFHGQCVHEQPVWHFNASECREQFDTCRAMEASTASYSQYNLAGGGGQSAYLTNSLESCSVDASGCGWYSLLYDTVSESWEGNSDLGPNGTAGNGQADRIYLNSSAQRCSKKDAGCTLLYKPSGISTTGPTINEYEETQNLIDQAQAGSIEKYSEASNIEVRHMKVSPDWMDCSPTNANMPTECNDYALECVLEDLGCQFYTPHNGDPVIPAIHADTDLCTEECVGFNQFTEVPSWFTDAEDGVIDGQPTRNPAPEFVPDTAQICKQAGCEEFTNLDEVSGGGEGTEYYTKIRQCVTPGAGGTQTYFTWEGSDTTGFQLKRWVMLQGAGGAPCTEVQPGSPTTCVAAQSCDPLVDGLACHSFFDNSGNSYNADIDQVIYSHEDCHPLRRTVGGIVYYGIPSLSQSCQSQNVGCLEYKGATANNIQVLFLDTFEPEDTAVDNLTFDWDGGLLVNESIYLNGHSLQVNGNAFKDVSEDVQGGYWYTVSFFAKSSGGGGGLTVGFDDRVASTVVFPGATLTAEWQYYELGPIQLWHPGNNPPTDEETLFISGNGFIDNIILKETPGTNLFIQDSWDQTLANQCISEGAYGCQMYTSGEGQRLSLRSFDHVCEERFVGCSAFIDTQNSLDFGATSYNTDNDDVVADPNSLLDNIRVAGDEAVLIVDNSDNYCGAQSKGCQLVGMPSFDRQADENASFSSDCIGGGRPCSQAVVNDMNEVTIINDPDQYNLILCQDQELFCTQYKVGDGIASYIDPGNRLCEYRENVATPTGITSNWFIVGSDALCPARSGNQLIQSASTSFDGWAGECQVKYDTCSRIIDVEDSNRPYFLIHDTLTDAIKECQEEGIVDREAGCRLFADTSVFGSKPDIYSEFAYDPTISPDSQPPQSNTTVFSVDPVTGENIYTRNIANIIAKVTPDRVCDQFLHCASSLVVQDKSDSSSSSGKEKTICLGIGLCNEIDSNGKCVDGSADLLGYNTLASEFEIENLGPNLSTLARNEITRAEWSTGMVKAGAIWPQGAAQGYFSYHEMKEIGSPLTVPNSDFEDPNNFSHRYSTWPDYIYPNPPGPKTLQNSKIVTREGGITPYEGERMLSMTLLTSGNVDDDRAYITTAPLPVSHDLDMSLSFYANFDSFIIPSNPTGICTSGHSNSINDSCTTSDQCNAGPTACDTSGGGSGGGNGYCHLTFEWCRDDADCGVGNSCRSFTCEGGPRDNMPCDPQDGASPNPYCSEDPIMYNCQDRGSFSSGGSSGNTTATGVERQGNCLDSDWINNGCTSNADCTGGQDMCLAHENRLAMLHACSTAQPCLTDSECGGGETCQTFKCFNSHDLCDPSNFNDCGAGDECVGVIDPPLSSLYYCSDNYNACNRTSPCPFDEDCGAFRCVDGWYEDQLCDPNKGTSDNPDCSYVTGYNVMMAPIMSYHDCSYGGVSAGIGSGGTCTAGTVGAPCSSASDCVPNDGLCEFATSVMKVKFLRDDGTSIAGDENPDYVKEVAIGRDVGGWRHVTLQFNIAEDDIGVSEDQYRIQLVVEDTVGSGQYRGSVQIDGLEVVSGLWTADNRVVGPECRLYSRSEALSCDDQDKSNISGGVIKTHKGWRGYCVESVPDQSDVCMNWWPVDIVQGDANFFGAGEVVDLDIANDLYYCLHSTGDLGNTTGDRGCQGTFNWGAANTPANYLCANATSTNACEELTLYGCLWDEDNSLCIGDTCSQFGTLFSGLYDDNEEACEATPGCNWSNFAGGYCYGTREGYCGGIDEWQTTGGGDCTVSGCTWTDPTELPEKPYVLEAHHIYYTYKGGKNKCKNWAKMWNGSGYTFGACSRNCGTGSKSCARYINYRTTWNGVLNNLPEARLHKSMIQTVQVRSVHNYKNEWPTWAWLDRSLEVTHNTELPSALRYLEPGETAWHVPCSSNPRGDNGDFCDPASNYFQLAVIFDTEGYFKGLVPYMNDHSGKKSEAASYRVYFVLRDVCQTMARVNTSYNAHTPWLSRFENSDERLLYSNFDHDNNPYGSIAPPSNSLLPYTNVSENPWFYTPMFAVTPDENLYCGGDSLIPKPCARTGTPYSIQRNAGYYHSCIAGAFEKLGKKCTTNDECTDPDLPRGKGLCGGFVGNNELIQGSPWAMDHGVQKLSRLWAKTYDIYGWDYSKEQYVLCDENNAAAMPITCLVPEDSDFGFGTATNNDATNRQYQSGIDNVRTGDFHIMTDYDITGCGSAGFRYNNTFICGGQMTNVSSWGHAPEINNIMVNNKVTGTVGVFSGEFVTLTFYPSLDANRQPLKGLKINWGDGTPYQPNQNLINLAGQGLPIQKYIFIHQYVCDSGSSCTYTPSVQLRDNWGWCTGDIYDCDNGDAGSWVSFEGQVEVEPTQLPPGTVGTGSGGRQTIQGGASVN